MAAFFVSLVLRLGGGEPLFHFAPLIHYPADFPFKTFAAAVGMLLLPIVSRLTGRYSEAQEVGKRLRSRDDGSVRSRVLAWGVHLFTALGLVCAAGMAVLIVQGNSQGAFLLMLVATLIDALDGTLARAARVSKVLPEFDGRRLDDIIDFQTYTSLPLLPDVARRPPRRRLASPAAARQRLRLLPQAGQDRRRVLPRLPVLLEYRGVLRLVSEAGRALHRRDRHGSRNPHLRADPLSLPEPARGPQPPHDRVGDPMDRHGGDGVLRADEWVLPSLYFPVFYMVASWWVTLSTYFDPA